MLKAAREQAVEYIEHYTRIHTQVEDELNTMGWTFCEGPGVVVIPSKIVDPKSKKPFVVFSEDKELQERVDRQLNDEGVPLPKLLK